MVIVLELKEYGCNIRQHVKQHIACIEPYISKEKRRIGLLGDSDVTEIQRDRGHCYSQRTNLRNPG